MPKIIANVREQIIAEARRQIDERGYESLTVRSVAKGCGIAVGTVYNYFTSKDMIVASCILEDWLMCTKTISEYPKEFRKDFLAFIHSSLLRFSQKNINVFGSEAAVNAYNASFFERHAQIREQLAELILPICDEQFTADYIAEAMLCWTMAGKSFEEIYSLLPERIK